MDLLVEWMDARAGDILFKVQNGPLVIILNPSLVGTHIHEFYQFEFVNFDALS